MAQHSANIYFAIFCLFCFAVINIFKINSIHIFFPPLSTYLLHYTTPQTQNKRKKTKIKFLKNHTQKTNENEKYVKKKMSKENY